jgi:hypothetical protein
MRVPFPSVGRRRPIPGGADTRLGDQKPRMPLAGGFKPFAMLCGASVGFALRPYTQRVYGVSANPSAISGYPEAEVHAGSEPVGLSLSVTGFAPPRDLINSYPAPGHRLGSVRDHSATRGALQSTLELTAAHRC